MKLVAPEHGKSEKARSARSPSTSTKDRGRDTPRRERSISRNGCASNPPFGTSKVLLALHRRRARRIAIFLERNRNRKLGAVAPERINSEAALKEVQTFLHADEAETL
jgi:hypothetical protein